MSKQTLSYTTALIAAGGSSSVTDSNHTGLPDYSDLVKFKITQDVPGGTYDYRIYKKDSLSDTNDLLAFWDNVDGTLFDPQDESVSPAIEAEEGERISYEDEDATGELHDKITNNDSVGHIYTVTITYIEVPKFAASGAVTFRTSLSLNDADVGHGVTDVVATTVFFFVDIDSGTDGGARVWGFSDTIGQRPMALHGVFGNTDPTDTIPAIALVGSKRSGTGRAVLGNAETVLKVVNYTTDLLTMLGDGNLGVGRAPASGSTILDLYKATGNIVVQAESDGVDSISVLSLINDAREWQIRNDGGDVDKFEIRDATAAAVRFSIDSSGSTTITVAGPNAVGVATTAEIGFRIGGTFTPSGASFSHRGVSFAQTINAVANESTYGLFNNPTIVEAGSGTATVIAGASFGLVITAGAAALTNAVVVDIGSLTAPVGTTTAFGIRVIAPTGASTNWAINSDGRIYANNLTAESATQAALCQDTTTKEVEVNTGVSTCLVSSLDFKDYVSDITWEEALFIVNAMRPGRFLDKGRTDVRFGFAAEWTNDVSRELTFYGVKGEPRSVDYERYTSVLTRVIQGQQMMIEVLSARLDSLNERLTS